MEFKVNTDWLLAVSLYRGKLGEYETHPICVELRQSVDQADYLIAPIADNRMFEIIDSFAQGEITDEQCRHCLSATSLGMQYVFKTERALSQLSILEHCYLCEAEKRSYLAAREEEVRVGLDKTRLAKREYRGQGKYIDEIFGAM